MDFSKKIKELREERGLTQSQLAEKLYISQSAIAKLENKFREPTGSTLIAYADFFNCSIDYLVGRETEEGSIIIKAEGLTDEEAQLIENFRAMDKAQKNAIQVTARNFVAKNKAESFKISN